MSTLSVVPSARRRPAARTGVPGRPHGGAGWVRHAAADLTPETIEAVAKRVAELLGGQQPEVAPSSSVGGAQLLDAAALARRLGVTRWWVYEHANELGAIAIGNGPRSRLRFRAELAEQALAQRRRTATPRTPVISPRNPHRGPRRRPQASSVSLLPIKGAPPRGILSRMRPRRRR